MPLRRFALRVIPLTLIAAAALAAAACTRLTPTAFAPGADTTVTLAPGAEVLPLGDVLRLSFLAVTSDGRCPSDVICIWQGNAVVQVGFAVGMGPTAPYDLNTTLDPREHIFGLYRITLVGLTPTPVSTSTVPAGDYRATLRVERFGPD